METFGGVVVAVLLGIILYGLIRNMGNHPEWFQKANLSKAFTTMGALALILIGFVALLVFLLRGYKYGLPTHGRDRAAAPTTQEAPPADAPKER